MRGWRSELASLKHWRKRNLQMRLLLGILLQWMIKYKVEKDRKLIISSDQKDEFY